jgi:O-antigen/teichoic acid export membrane protein
VVLHTGARPILVVLSDDRYLAAGSVLEIQCFALITVFITGAWITTLIGMRRIRLLIATTAIGVIAVLGCGFALIPPFDANGGAYAAVTTDVIFCIAMYGALVRGGLRSQLAAGSLLRIAAAAIPAFARGPLPTIVTCVLATALYLLLVAVLRELPHALESRLRRLVRRPG